MIPTLDKSGRVVIVDGLSIPWDAENNRPIDYTGEAGRVWQSIKNEEGISDPAPYVPPPPPDPGMISPRLTAAALGVTVENGDISSIAGAFNLVAALYLDVGLYMLLFMTPEPDNAYSAVVQGAAPYMRVIEQEADYLIIEARDGINGSPVDSPQFNAQLFRI